MKSRPRGHRWLLVLGATLYGGLVSARALADTPESAPAAAAPASAEAPKPGDGATTPRDAAPPPTDVRVQGARREVGGATIRRDDAREIPGTFGDPTKFVEALPGVVPTTSGSQSFFVRGAPPETSGFFVDGIPVPALYHVGFGPAVVHPALLDHVDFFPGAAPARYGRAVGAVLDAETAEPVPRLHGEGNLRLFDASALAKTPFGDGRGSVLASGRYAYPGPVVSLFDPSVGLSYWDYQARATWQLSDHERIGALTFGSNDLLTSKNTNAAGYAYTAQLVSTQFHRVDLRYDDALGPRDTLRVAVTLGHDAIGNETASGLDTLARLRSELDLRPSRKVRIRAGADVQLDHFAVGANPEQAADPTPPQVGLPVTPRNDVTLGVRADVAWRILPGVEIVPGIRVDMFTSRRTDSPPPGSRDTSATAVPAIDPRLAARVALVHRVTWVSTVGIAHQMPGLVASTPTDTPMLQGAGVEQGLKTSAQLSEGFEVALPEGFTSSATAFLHHYTNLPDLTAPCTTSLDPTRCIELGVDGRAYGLELLVKRALTERFAIFVAYTLSRSTRQAHGEGGGGPLTWIPSEYDRTHVVSAMAAYDLGHHWRVGARVVAYSGRPYSETYMGVPLAPYNDERLPGFFRLDARLEKSWRVGATGRVSFVVEGVNVTANKEVDGLDCQPAPASGPVAPYTGGALPAGAQTDRCTNDYLGPITIPSVGVEGSF